ncbi:hypothetical protein AR9_g035 [Bacillus phage AR9]|uniref:Uncharacterized protein n=1 Tax=Bacillus phage AR9 TaxID=1815509 RepID=A0A172JHU5_BPPB1|nr:hypothetical protein BI022_gp035 [Bacillus phage AR9]AMS01120.1 hypothetical protein AR9_g035 [Bacillus phage AR9]
MIKIEERLKQYKINIRNNQLYLSEDSAKYILDRKLLDYYNYILNESNKSEYLFKYSLTARGIRIDNDNKIIVEPNLMVYQKHWGWTNPPEINTIIKVLIISELINKLMDEGYEVFLGNNTSKERNLELFRWMQSQYNKMHKLSGIDNSLNAREVFKDISEYLHISTRMLSDRILRNSYTKEYVINARPSKAFRPPYTLFNICFHDLELDSKLNRLDLDLYYIPFIKDIVNNQFGIALMKDYVLLNNDSDLENFDKIDKYFDELLQDAETRLPIISNIEIKTKSTASVYFQLIDIKDIRQVTIIKRIKSKYKVTSRNKHPLSKYKTLKGSQYFSAKLRESQFKALLLMIKYFEEHCNKNDLARAEKILSLKEVQNYLGYEHYKHLYEDNPKFKNSFKRVKDLEAIELLENL